MKKIILTILLFVSLAVVLSDTAFAKKPGGGGGSSSKPPPARPVMP